MKNRTPKNKTIYEEYKNLFETNTNIKNITFQNESWNIIIIEIIEKNKDYKQQPPREIFVNGKNILDKKEIVSKFNNFSKKIGPKEAEKIQVSKYSFKSYFDSIINTRLPEKTFSVNELKEAFSTRKWLWVQMKVSDNKILN